MCLLAFGLICNDYEFCFKRDNRFVHLVGCIIDACVYLLCLWIVLCIVKVRRTCSVSLQSKALDMYPVIPVREHGIK